jgi:hypothetical protein
MHKRVGTWNGLPTYARLAGTSQVEGVINQKAAQSSSYNAGPELISTNLELFFHGIVIKSRVKNETDFKYIGFCGYASLEILQELHRIAFNVPYPLWYRPIRAFLPSVDEQFGIIPVYNEVNKQETPGTDDLALLTAGDGFLATRQRSKVCILAYKRPDSFQGCQVC